MTLDEAYQKLGLVQLDEYLASTDRNEERYIGASTWMCVAAVLNLLEGKNSMLVAGESSRVLGIYRKASEFAEAFLQLEVATKTAVNTTYRIAHGGAVVLAYRQAQPGETFLNWIGGSEGAYTIFHDESWKEKALRRRAGPYAMISQTKKVGERYFAFDQDNNFVLELTRAGAETLRARNGAQIVPVRLPNREDLIRCHGTGDGGYLGALQNVYQKLGIPPLLAKDSDR